MVKRFGYFPLSLLALCQSVSCMGEAAPVFPVGLGPVMDNTANYPEATDRYEYPEEVNIVTGTASLPWVHGRGYVHGSIERVWEAMREPEVLVDRRNVDEWAVEYDIDDTYSHSFRIHNIAHEAIDVEFYLEWRQDVIDGSPAAPGIVASRSSLSESTLFLTTVEVSTTLIAIDDSTTAIEIVQVVDAISTDELVLRTAVGDWFDDMTAWIAGEEMVAF